ncbi:RdgB/HAM1 family non-canonical purine NTP pyrophosphatase [Trichothermofontia sichuanensis B231]|uniref:RdgB/HAM1 family non-canonical purine NTP pyrophosphatase n=1 Tax=Trichothermofontia sichuanensis TaxID=3045816 RepID=UPI0022481229|nr:RdgB/HAM1 family non-canonical purine NTP pyrophosphatase [Trichothermofontia sichuanensis]UZQ53506.1 RdgB/HAM1 family non-canonical purine NTP pyrophosphatase [Trichothermofontia sichuanensis B231]
MPILVVATSNPGKLKELEAHLSTWDWQLQLKPAALAVEETGDSFAANACLKAATVAQATGQWAIADDSGLVVNALNGAPGIYSARYGATDTERIERLLRELGDATDRSAQFVCAIALARPDGMIAIQTEGVCTGEILRSPRGTGGFGYDPIFYVPEQGLTFAEMPPELKRSLSHRGRALTALAQALSQVSRSQNQLDWPE